MTNPTLQSDFEKTIQTIIEVERERDRGLWDMGDALGRDIAESNVVVVDVTTFRSCAKELNKQLGPYKADRLHKLYVTAAQFPPAQRCPDIPWHVYAAAGSPDNLQRVLNGLRQLGWPPTEPHAECVAAVLRGDCPAAEMEVQVAQWIAREELRKRKEMRNRMRPMWEGLGSPPKFRR